MTGGEPCRSLNPNRRRICERCGKRRPARKEPSHRAVLKALSYEDWIDLNGGEQCGICGKGPVGRRLNRDHEHKGEGRARGLLCPMCNKRLHGHMDLDWLRSAVAYLERTVS